ncbi:MAG: transcription antitermination factor NusB [bacterium]|nr:transcription antitermination factor NusB [bacterium]
MGKRRKGREIVLQSMYASLMGGGDVPAVLEDQLLRRESAPETVAFARDLAAKVKANRPDTERWLRTLISVRWDPSRVGALERCILLLGLTELRHSPEVPFRAVINEACELAHRYCEDAAVGFVNGVLDRAAHETYPDLAGLEAGALPAVDDLEASADEPSGDGGAGGAEPDLDADFGDTPLRSAPAPGGEPA